MSASAESDIRKMRLAGQSLKSWTLRGLARLAAAESLMGGLGAGAGAAAVGAHGLGLGALAALPGLAMASPRLAGYGAFGVDAAGRFGANAIDKLGPFGTLPYGSIALGPRQLGRLDQNPFNPSP